MSFFVSAPGKAILFGEHSAVYGKPAIAAALSLRAYMLVEEAAGGEIELFFPDLDISDRWAVADLPWDAVQRHVSRDAHGRPQPTAELCPEILAALAPCLLSCTPGLHYTACRCFLYLYMNMCGPALGGRFCIRLTVPIGAGLGSSAAVSVCLSAGMAVLGGHVPLPGAAPGAAPDFIDAWSFMGEKCFHGTPSGIDNAVATYGGAVLYQRAAETVRLNLKHFPELALLLTNTKVPRSTATLVGHVAEQHRRFPQVSGPILDAMAAIVQEAHDIMQEQPLDRARLRHLVNINHGLLVALGVSHPSLEKVKIAADKIGATKLTGAGGGGCALTILEDEVTSSDLDAVQQLFESMGLETYSTALGGKGVGMLLPTEETKKYFSKEAVVALETREAVDAAVGTANVPEWKYW